MTIQLTGSVARKASQRVSFEALAFGPPDKRIAAWEAVILVCLYSKNANEMNRWWRSIMPSDTWKKRECLYDFAQRNIRDIREAVDDREYWLHHS